MITIFIGRKGMALINNKIGLLVCNYFLKVEFLIDL